MMFVDLDHDYHIEPLHCGIHLRVFIMNATIIFAE